MDPLSYALVGPVISHKKGGGGGLYLTGHLRCCAAPCAWLPGPTQTGGKPQLNPAEGRGVGGGDALSGLRLGLHIWGFGERLFFGALRRPAC
jgi:hypothetical protein